MPTLRDLTLFYADLAGLEYMEGFLDSDDDEEVDQVILHGDWKVVPKAWRLVNASGNRCLVTSPEALAQHLQQGWTIVSVIDTPPPLPATCSATPEIAPAAGGLHPPPRSEGLVAPVSNFPTDAGR